MKHLTTFFCFSVFSLSLLAQTPRLLITTDIGGDPDDQQSLVRLMVYSNEFDIEGIITSASGTPGELKEAMVRPDLVEEIIRGYQAVYPNLLKHNDKFPTPEKLLSVVKKGNPLRGWVYVGEGHDTEGSEWIIHQVDKKDQRPLNMCIFGGQTDLAQALWKVKYTRTENEYKKFTAKIRIYDIHDQDLIFNQIMKEHPDLFYILSSAPEGVDKREGVYRGIYLGGDESLTSLDWLKENVLENHGSLGVLYPTKTWTSPNPHGAMKEGDTPSWFYFLKNGLQNPEHPEYGGWGGRYLKTEQGCYRDAQDSTNGEKNARATVYRWRDDFQRDFAARMDWCVKDYDKANHLPAVVVNGNTGNEVLEVKAKPGKIIELDASESIDPDGNKLNFEWMVYKEASDPINEVSLYPDGSKLALEMLRLLPGNSIHIILKVTDNGKYPLSSYKRIVLLHQ